MDRPKPVWNYPLISCDDPLFQKAYDWEFPTSSLEEGKQKEMLKHILHVTACWSFLKPLFSSHGYTLYRSMDDDPWNTYPEPLPKAVRDPKYPYARRCYEADEDGVFGVNSGRIWAARDALGHDVVIKVISDADNPSNEFKVLQYLNEEGVRSDPRNLTIHVLEFLTIYNLVFAVMPRWDAAFRADFGTVAEVMQCGEQILECFGFLQEHRIFHGDFLDQNMGLNIATNSNKFFLIGLRDPSVTRYAVYDFGNSEIYPRDVSLRDFRANPWFKFSNYGLPFRNGPFNPFAVDFLSVIILLQCRVRHIENIVPAVGPYFDRLMSYDDDSRPTAREALVDFRQIVSQLSVTQISEKISTHYWKDGVVYKK
ncbi:hypothetical protein M413DRAFT_199530 [Hebeloma cylindrosporum]|uniref:Protein kinase domain-containing protein n=1 Tax=Hebeloma cylindrosporum TaxID=76867 RepID=A0A0C3CTI8_HEBCY|nr:hypothetical protein M413DRAFT_199530 [Hebeloma cylindrosporum h7]